MKPNSSYKSGPDGMQVIARGLRFPEGPVVMDDGSIAVVEIERGTVSRIALDGTITVIAHVGGGPNGMALGPHGDLYVCNNGGFIWHEKDGRLQVGRGTPDSYTGGSIQRVDPETGVWTTLYNRCGDIALRGPNDIVFDAHGGFYFTDFGKMRARDRDLGCVYYALSDGSGIVEVIHPLLAPNGLALSPDGKTLYVAETDTSRMWAFQVLSPGRVAHDQSAAPHGGRCICNLPGFQRLDSMAVQANGDVCVATLVTGRISVISPIGGLLRQVDMPDPDTTNICFGGPDMQTAYVTLSSTGTLVAIPWSEPGLAGNFGR
jgi:gluconolactonase